MLIGNKRLWGALTLKHSFPKSAFSARLAQSVERKALNLVVVGSSPTVGVPVVNWEPLSVPEKDPGWVHQGAHGGTGGVHTRNINT